MQNTSFRYFLEASPFAEPIHFEPPQIKHFYEQNVMKMEETPNKRCNTIFTLITSPADAESIARRQLLMMRHSDIFSEHNDFMHSERKSRVDEHQMIFNRPYKHQSLALKDQESDTFSDGGNDDKDNVSSSPNDMKDDDDSKLLNDYEREMRRLSSKEEIRKRKRKSNHQLKILKWEFEKDGYWDKEKILTVAKNTGLSESQVYKWCWDQKKKIEANSKDKSKCRFILEDKENVPPKEHYGGILKTSKLISKFRVNKGKTLGMGRSAQKLKLKTLSDKNIIVDDVNKRLNFL